VKPLTPEQIKNEINFLLRQADMRWFPVKVPMSDWLKARVDEATAQKIYDELLAERQECLCEMTVESMVTMAKEIMEQGVDKETAYHYAALIGDTPCFDDAGNLIVRDGTQEIARLKPLKSFGRNQP
jgi:hypothetical protein